MPNLPAATPNADMAPFPWVTSQLPGGRLITLACFPHERHRTLFLVKKTLAFYIVSLQMVLVKKIGILNTNNKTHKFDTFDAFLPIDESQLKGYLR